MAKYTDHHVPPQCWKEPHTFKLRVQLPLHTAYHDLFWVPHTFEEAQRILIRKYPLYCQARLPPKQQHAFRLLFGDAKDLEEMKSILREKWWTRKMKRGKK